MVTAPEAAALLAMSAQFDNRKPSADAARGWAKALERVDFRDASDAIVAHYRESSDWIMPADVIRLVRKADAVFTDVLDELEPPERIMSLPDGPEFNAAYLGWLKEQRRRLRRGEPLEVGNTPVIGSRHFSELVS